MWFFSCPQVVYGEGALGYLTNLPGRCACIVTDARLNRLGYANKVRACLPDGMESAVFDAVEPDPSLETVRRGAEFMRGLNPDWIIAVGGGSVLDAAKGMWILYERPDVDPAAINPIERYGLRQKARFAAVPTTAGTGSEATWAIVLTDLAENRKLGLGSREALPDYAILDPDLVMELPQRLTADTGLDTLAHAIEGYTSTYHNDFCDGLCLNAARLVFDWLPRAYTNGADREAREHMQNAATIAGMGFGNSMAALAHGLGHALGGVFHTPHGRAVALFLPYTLEYCARGEPEELRYTELAQFLGMPLSSQAEAAAALAARLRALMRAVDQPLTLAQMGIDLPALEAELDQLAAHALNDTQTIMAARVPDYDDLRRLFLAAWAGDTIDF